MGVTATPYGRLEIAVGEVFRVHTRKRPQNLRRDNLCLVFGEHLHILQVLLQVPVLAVLHSDVQPPGALIPTVRLDEEFGILPTPRSISYPGLQSG